jgi:ankyrin repeat protein
MQFDELWRRIDGTRGIAELRQFVMSGGNVDQRHSMSGWTLLHVASEYQNLALIQALIAGGANINSQNHHGWTPLHLAVDADIDSVIQSGDGSGEITFLATRALLSHGADVTIQDAKGKTPRDVAAAYSADLALRFDSLLPKVD